MARKRNYADLFTLRKDGRYQGTYYDKNGVRRFVYDKDPEKLYHKLLQLEQNEPKPVTFAEVLDTWELRHREEIEPRTWSNYAPHVADIRSKYGTRPAEEIEAADIVNDLARAKAAGYSYTVVNSRRSIWRMALDQAILDGQIKYNPAVSVKLPKGLKHGKRTAPTKAQMQIILSHVDAPFGLFPFLLLCTGLRKSEALSLRWSDVDLTSRVIRVDKSLDYTSGSNPKYKAPKTVAGNRIVPIIDILYPVLLDAKRKSSNDLLFPAPPSNRGGKGGGLMTDRAYDGAWLRYCRAAGLMDGDKPALTAHNLRHGTATLMFELEVDELTTQKILGHSRIEITRAIYTDLRNEQKARSVSKFNRGMSKLMSDTVQQLK